MARLLHWVFLRDLVRGGLIPWPKVGVENAKGHWRVHGTSGERSEGRSQAHSGDDYYFCIWLKIDKLIAEPIVKDQPTH